MKPLAARGVALGFGLAVWALSGAAAAAPCGRPDIDLTFPPNQAQDVPTNAVLTAHYAAPAIFTDETVDVTDSAGNAVPVTVSYDDADSTLRASPDQALTSGSLQVVWPGLRGVSGSGGLGRGSTVSFVVGNSEDAAAPIFSGLTGVDWDLARDRDPCLDKLDDRFVFTLDVGTASDDSRQELLSLLVFQTRDPTAPDRTDPARVAVLAVPDSGRVEVRRPATKAGKTCFAAVVQDLLGRVSGGGEREVCVSTKLPPFFEGCSVEQPGATKRPSALVLALLGLGLLRRGRRAERHLART